MSSKVSVVDKQRLYDAWLSGEDYVELARHLGIKRTTAWAIIKRANNRDGLVSVPRGGRRHSKIDNEIGEVLAEIVEEHPAYTLHQMKSELQIRLPHKPALSLSSISRCLTGRLIVMKKLEISPSERNSGSTKDSRKDYADWMLRDGVGQELIFIDEAGINLWVQRTRGRAPVGQRAVRVVGGQRGRNFTVVFAVSNRRGLINHDIFEGGMTCEKFHTFLMNTSALIEDPVTYIFDNASCHSKAHLSINDGGPQVPANHYTHRLPPYSPFLNIVEMAISAFKACLKRHLEEVRHHLLQENQQQRLATLVQLAEQSVAVITSEKCLAWFGHTQTYLPRCLAKEDILM